MQGANNRKIPLKDFFRNREKVGFKISPDGQHLAYLSSYERRMNIFVQKIGSSESIRLSSEVDRGIADYFWDDNERIIFAKDKDGDENYRLFAVDIQGKEQIDLTPFEDVQAHIVDDLEEIQNELLVGLNNRNKELFDVYRLNTRSGELKMVAENPGNISSWHTDHNGLIRLATTTDGVNSSLLYRENEEEAFREILVTDFKMGVTPLFFTFDNKQFYASSNLDRDKSAIVTFDPETGKEVEVLFAHDEVDVLGLSYSRKRKKLTAARYESWKTFHHFFDDTTKNIYNDIVDRTGGKSIAISSRDRAEERFIVRTYSDRSMGKYFLFDSKTSELTELADVSPWLNEDDMAEMKPVHYPSRDGLKINGYLSLPVGKEAKNLPVVINPHGGPWHRDSWGFNPEVQFLCNRGYAVLQMNFRGSTGYGRDFWTASFGQWGLNMQNDISDGVQWLIEEGIADPDRVAIYGGSYGGYATLAGVTFTPDLYRCAIDYVGVSNLFSFMATIPPYWKPYLEMMYEMVGHPERDKERLTETSPVFHVDKIKAPLFVAQGAKDPRVNVDESDQIVAALKKKNVDVQYMVKEDEGHGFRNEENRFEFYDAMESFLSKHMS